MQYWPYLVMPGLKPVSRYQIAFRDADVLRIARLDRAACARLADGRQPRRGRISSGRDCRPLALFVITLTMWFAPKIATVLDVVSRPVLRRSFGGAGTVHRQHDHRGRFSF